METGNDRQSWKTSDLQDLLDVKAAFIFFDWSNPNFLL